MQRYHAAVFIVTMVAILLWVFCPQPWRVGVIFGGIAAIALTSLILMPKGP